MRSGRCFLALRETSMEKPNLTQQAGEYRHSRFWNILLLLALLAFGLKCVAIALTTPFSFDGSLTAQVARSLVENGTYATTYDKPILFDPVITTGLPVILPVALSFRLFGSTFSAGLMVNALYAWLFAAAVVWYLLQSLRLHPFYALLALALIAFTPQFYTWTFGLYGEGPKLFYLMLTAILLQRFETDRKRRTLFWAGLCLGLAGLTKMIALIALPAAAAALAYARLWRRERKPGEPGSFKVFILDLLVFGLGLLLPFVGYALYQFLVLGADTYILRQTQRISFVLGHPGLLESKKNLADLLLKTRLHLRVASGFVGAGTRYLGLTMLMLLLALGLALLTALPALKASPTLRRVWRPYSSGGIFLTVLTVSLFGWWLLITALPWERYLFPAFVLLVVVLTSALGLSRKRANSSPGVLANLSADFLQLFLALSLGLLAAAWGVQAFRQGTYKISFQDTEEKTGYLRAAAFIQALPEDSKIFGYGWWQAPVLSFAADTYFYDYYAHPELLTLGELKDTYLVSDLYATYLDPESLHNVLKNFDYELIYQDELNKLKIYQLRESVP